MDMKKITIFLALIMMVSVSQAQIGSAIGKKLKEKAAQTIGGAIGGKENSESQDSDRTKTAKTDVAEDDELTPDKVIAMVPTMPTPQQLSEYLCESHRANPRTLKMLANPTTSYLTQLGVAGVGGYATMTSQYGHLYNFDEQLLEEFGITQKQYEAMSEQEQQDLALKYAAELEDRYYKTIERLGSDEGYKKLIEKYNEIEDQINKIYSDADSVCRAMWEKRFAGKDNVSDDDRCAYYRQAMPDYYQAVVQAMRVRKTTQMAQAKQIDAYVQTLSKRYPKEVYAGMYSQSSICATAYVADAMRVTTIPAD